MKHALAAAIIDFSIKQPLYFEIIYDAHVPRSIILVGAMAYIWFLPTNFSAVSFNAVALSSLSMGSLSVFEFWDLARISTSPLPLLVNMCVVLLAFV